MLSVTWHYFGNTAARRKSGTLVFANQLRFARADSNIYSAGASSRSGRTNRAESRQECYRRDRLTYFTCRRGAARCTEHVDEWLGSCLGLDGRRGRMRSTVAQACARSSRKHAVERVHTAHTACVHGQGSRSDLCCLLRCASAYHGKHRPSAVRLSAHTQTSAAGIAGDVCQGRRGSEPPD